MTSPLAPYYNGLMLTDIYGVPSISSGRITNSSNGSRYLIKVFCKSSNNTEQVPTVSLRGQQIPGSNGFSTEYSGYAFSVADISNISGYELNAQQTIEQNIRGLVFNDINGHPGYLGNGLRGQILLGLDDLRGYQIINFGGRYNGLGIDELIYTEISGVPIRLQIGQVAI